MKVIEITKFGDPSVLKLTERPIPKPKPGEVLIKVAAAGVNRPDSLQRQGQHPPPPGASDIPGLDVAGQVIDLGEGVMEPRKGQHVCALLEGGGYAEYCTARWGQCIPIPDGMDLITAAAIPETYFTVWTNVFERGRLSAGEIFLVHGGASGIGTTAIQLAVIRGARVFSTTGKQEKNFLCEQLGSEKSFNYRQVDFRKELLSYLGGAKVNLILDIVGGSSFENNLSLLDREGRLIIIALLGGASSQIDLSLIMAKHLTVTGSRLRHRKPEEKRRIARALQKEVWPLLEAGKIKPIIQATYPLEEAHKAHSIMDSDGTMGKLVLLTDS